VYTFHQSWWRILVPGEPHYALSRMYKVCKSRMRLERLPRTQCTSSEHVNNAMASECESIDCDVKRSGLSYTSYE